MIRQSKQESLGFENLAVGSWSNSQGDKDLVCNLVNLVYGS